jgi:2-polyprenyl-6-methoxyphenol hydroxylase-like FAD-dependent oxidoreductase
VHSPAGGQGMNAGIADAVALAESLGVVLDGGSPGLLDTYTATRRPVAQQVVSLADRLTRLATVNRRLRPVRNLALRLLARRPAFRRQLARRLSGLAYH